MRLFGSPNNAGRPQNGQKGDWQEQNDEERNAAHTNDKQEDNPKILASGANVDDNTTLATQNDPVSSNALNSISKRTEKEHGGGRKAAHVKNNLEDNSEVLATGAGVDDHTTLATQSEPVSSNALNSTLKKTEEEHGEGRNAARANDKQNDNPQVLSSGANVGVNTTLATQKEPDILQCTQQHSQKGRGRKWRGKKSSLL